MEFKYFPRVRSSLTIEGLALIIILGFVAVCSVLRNVNLLVVVTGMMMMPLLLCWRISRTGIRNVIVDRILCNRAHANASVNIQWKITNAGPIDLYRMKIVDNVRHIFSRNGEVKYSRKRFGVAGQGNVNFEKVAVYESRYVSYQIHFSERGIYEFGPSFVENRFPLGLFKSWFTLRDKHQIHVAPRLGELAPDWISLLMALTQGTSLKSGRKGMMEEDFFAIREWRSGDNKRKIHWRSTAKFGEPMVKQFDRSTEQNLAIVLDLVADSGLASGIEFNQMAANCEKVLSFAATVVSNWADQPFGQLIVAVSDLDSKVLNSNNENEFIAKAMRSLAVAQNGYGNRLAGTLKKTADLAPPNCATIVISSRSRSDAEQQTDPQLIAGVHWIQPNDAAFGQVFRSEDMEWSMEPEFAPA